MAQLTRFVPPAFTAYTEAFVGSGALFFHLAAAGRFGDRPVTLIDNNADLIGTYAALARDPVSLIDHLLTLARSHQQLGTEWYYEVRDRRFNPERARLRAGQAGLPYPADLAAEFVYLNRTCFNGLFRLNASGDFNVPAGRYSAPRICDERNLMRVSALLRQPNVFILHDTFERLWETAESGEFIYFDPPYAPVSPTSHFRAYTTDGFSDEQQERLQQLVVELARRKCWVLLSNSVAPQITRLYDRNVSARRAGLRAFRIPARRAINSKAGSRGPVEEYLITNVPT